MKPNESCDIKVSFCQKNRNDGFDFDGKGGTLAHGFILEKNFQEIFTMMIRNAG